VLWKEITNKAACCKAASEHHSLRGGVDHWPHRAQSWEELHAGPRHAVCTLIARNALSGLNHGMPPSRDWHSSSQQGQPPQQPGQAAWAYLLPGGTACSSCVRRGKNRPVAAA
jgi:hypothetical protein